MNESLIPMSYVQRLLAQAAQAGCDTSEILREAKLTQQQLETQSDVSARRYAMLYQLVMRASEDEWFGMFMGGKVPLGSFRMMCLTLLSCNTLKQAIIRTGEFAEICRGMRIKFLLNEQQGITTLRMAPVRNCSLTEFDDLINRADPGHILNSIIAWHKFAEWLTGKEIRLASIYLSHARSQAGEPLAFVQEQNLLYQCPYNGFAVERDVLEYPLVQDHDSLMAFLLTAPYHLVTQDPLKLGLAERVRNILKREISRNMPSAEKLAEQLNMSVTTLRRQLGKEGTSYQKLKDECRMEAAIHYLAYQELSNSDIAEKLGFDEPSAFFRSFKKWTGQTPGEYRARHLL
ncbi:AraC-like DNA-binding protein [Alteromonadaceae bacterium 2753L.S.0a.02]|nr:AraC-like DNA-binding protein [Alteromonadaceae bacterium 2753L.S.0a.02]